MEKLLILLGILVATLFKQCPPSPPCITCNSSKDSLWNYVLKKDDILGPGQPKFMKLSKCVKVTGTVIQSVFSNSGDDGDGSIVIQLDTNDYRLVKELDSTHIKKLPNTVECEVIWYDTTGNLPFYVNHVRSAHYINHIKLSDYRQGEKVAVSGMLIIDNAGAGQYEIHPVFSVDTVFIRK
jgi:hypothetical protein